MSFTVSPSPVPLSGSLLVTEVRTKVGDGVQTSDTTTLAAMSASVLFGGQSGSGLTLAAIVGGWVSATVIVATHCLEFDEASVAVNVTFVGPTGRKLGAVFV